MPASSPFSTIHPSALRPSLPRLAIASVRSKGAIRYRCPETGSFILVTHPAMVEKLSRPDASVRCPGCGDTHLLRPDEDTADIVAARTQA
jgi:predicted RNA-binding Zn-ribbon protein involved in translation (DUF1610 family)